MSSIVLWWLVLQGLGLVSLPLIFPLFSRRSDHGYAFGKIITLLLLTYLSWLAGFVLPMGAAVYGTLGVLIGAGALAAWLQRRSLAEWMRNGGWQAVVRQDVLWTAGFLFFAWHRSLNPEIFQQEKYMDFAFYNLLARTDTMPPQDPWMSGETINYYYFGYLMFADLARLVPLPTFISYNLCVATIGGLGFSQTVAVVLALTRRWGLALLGGAMSVLLGNLDGFLQLIEKGTVRGMDFWRSSRIVDRDSTINEFPFFSTIHGDLHPHFMVLPVSILLVGVLLDEALFPSAAQDQPRSGSKAWLRFVVVTFVLGSMVAISNWELPTGALLVALLAGRWQPLLPLFSKDRLLLIGSVAGVLVGSYVFFLPFYLGFDPPLGGVGVRFARTALGEFLTVNGALLYPLALLLVVRIGSLVPDRPELRHFLLALTVFLLMIGAMLGNAVFPLLLMLLAGAFVAAYADPGGEVDRSRGSERGGYLLAATAVTALLVCEVVYIKDAYGERLYRMNTVFKFYFQAWTLLAVAAPWCVGRLLDHRWEWRLAPRSIQATVGLLIAASACYPLGITLDRMGRKPTLNGNAYLEQPQFRSDLAAMEWLRRHANGDAVLLEATGNPYSYFSRFSSNTGLPTVLGWANHEGLWRGHDQEVNRRRSDVDRMYNAPTLDDVEGLLAQYGVRYIVVGDLERQQYQPSGLRKFESLEVAFQSDGTTVYRWPADRG